MKKIISVILVFIMLLGLCSCAVAPHNNGGESKEESTSQSESKEDKKEKISVNIVESPAESLEKSLVQYSDPAGNFTAMIPAGWKVSTAGYDMYYWIRIYSPSDPNLQVFTLLKAECLLYNQASKDFYEANRGYTLYTMFADMIVVEKVEDFYSQFMDYCSFMSRYEPTYAGFEYPQISQFEVVQKYPFSSYMSPVAKDEGAILGNYINTLSQEKGEGMFTGTLTLGIDLGGVGCNCMYNINAITAPYGELSEYANLLNGILNSIQYTDGFVNTVMTDQQIKANGAAALNQTLQETSAIITDGWNARQQTYDVAAEKYSDAILGYERVYDVETGEVYKAYNGFSETQGIDNYYKPITDDMYSSKISGYIEK